MQINRSPSQCELCLGSFKVIGLGDCPQCVLSGDDEEYSASQRALYERIASTELQHRPRTLSENIHVRLHAVAKRCLTPEPELAELLSINRALKMELEITKRGKGCDAAKRVQGCDSNMWHRTAMMDEDVSDERKVREFFARRQKKSHHFGQKLRILECIKVENPRLKAFKPNMGCKPRLIFHGSPEQYIANILTEGLLMKYCGRCGGIFGAWDPRISFGYASKMGGERFFMFLCVYDLPMSANEGSTEVNVPSDDVATVLWLLKVERGAKRQRRAR
jgi:hypothetical protein